jgi:hypothetical protein
MSTLTVEELARRYVSKVPGAVSGSGGHNQTFTVACALVKGFDLSVDQARPLLWEYNQRCDPAWSASELEHKLVQADRVGDERERGWLRLEPLNAEGGTRNAERQNSKSQMADGKGRGATGSSGTLASAPPEVPAKATFEEGKLKAFAARWRQFVDTAWLADRSPVMPYGVSADGFLRTVFREGEKVVFFTNQKSQGQGIWPDHAPPEGGPEGVWYLAQPVDGLEHENPRSIAENGLPKMSRRSEESVTDWRHLVLESDAADARDWMGALVQLPLRIAAIYTSGGRSIHALVRVDAPTKQEWDNVVKQIRPALVTLGADPKAMSAVRLTRLPGCYRGEKLQKLLYLDPDPVPRVICSRPRLRDVVGTWRAFIDGLQGMTPAEVNTDAAALAMVRDCLTALRWFQSAPPAAEQLERVVRWSQTV